MRVKYLQIRVKSTVFQDEPACAVYFFDLTSQIESLQLSMRLLSKERASSLSHMNFLKLASDLENPLSSMMLICDSML